MSSGEKLPSVRPGIDVDYTMGYVALGDASIDYEGNCGNISQGVGPFAVTYVNAADHPRNAPPKN